MTRLNTLALLTISHTQQHSKSGSCTWLCQDPKLLLWLVCGSTRNREEHHWTKGNFPHYVRTASGNWLSFRNNLLGEHTPLGASAHALGAAGRHAAKTTQRSSGEPLPVADPALRSAGADIFLSKSMSWEDALLVYSSFWQWRMGVQGVLRTAGQHRRKVTIQKRNQLPHPCPRTMQEAARATLVPRAKNGRQQIRQTAGDWRPEKRGQTQPKERPFKSSWRALSHTGRTHRVFSEEAAITTLSLSLCTHSRTRVSPHAHLRACVSTASGKAQHWVKPLVTDGWWTGCAHGRQAPTSSVSQITSYPQRANVLWHWRVGGHHLNQVIKLSVTNGGPAGVKCLPTWCMWHHICNILAKKHFTWI